MNRLERDMFWLPGPLTIANQQVQLKQQLSRCMPDGMSAAWIIRGVLATQYAVKAGGSLQIWVDDDGNRVDQPTPIARAAMDALSVAVVGWSVVALAVAEVVAAVRAHLKRIRDTQWAIAIRSLVEDDGGRTNHSQ